MKVVDIANQIYLENDSPRDTSIPAIAFWIRTNVGKLNTLLYECFHIDPTTLDIFNGNCLINPLVDNIIKTMYKIYRIELDIRRNMVSMQCDSVIQAQDEDFLITRLNKSEIFKTLVQLKKDTLKELTDMVHYYRSYNGAPSQVSGDDMIQGCYLGISEQYVRSVV